MLHTLPIKWLLARLYEPDLVIVDCRFWLNDTAAGEQKYLEEHIPRAVYLDLDKDLSATVTEHGGRHPLPDVEAMCRTFGQAGINRDSRVVIYDDNNGMNAARAWWMLTYLGHEQVYVLEQDFTAWKQAKYPVTQERPIVVPTSFTAQVKSDMLAQMEEVREVSSQAGQDDKLPTGSTILVDSRDHRRYLGLEEPLDKEAGHIPGAINFFWKDVVDEDGSLKNKEQLEQHFSGLDKDAEIIVYCGSGVSACPNVLGLKRAGFNNVKLYAGSWSDWISYEENPVAIGKE
jgi:thiosulfate/3-mercaptopyruvate sulfurtransferase